MILHTADNDWLLVSSYQKGAFGNSVVPYVWQINFVQWSKAGAERIGYRGWWVKGANRNSCPTILLAYARLSLFG